MKTRLVTLLSLLAAVGVALLAPSAVQARHVPDDALLTQNSDAMLITPVSTSSVADLRDDRLGPKYVTIPPATVPVVNVVAPDAFDWADALIGAAVAATALVAVAGAALVVTRHAGHHPAHA